ncbi:MAG: hypothetical protein JXR51_14605 [Bacteroidales bacterium]|nr:hypothetical protein [Bacteroidales bacterium]MBN2758401.1 hypothetical protein [Bacteroidales bacterium]
MEKFQKIISQTISVLFHPLLIPTYTLFIIFNSGTFYSFIPFQTQKILYVLVILTTFIIPVSIMPFLLNLKLISNFMLEERKDRIIPLIVTSISYFFTLYLLKQLPFHVPQFIFNFILASAILIVLLLLISLKWKISAHTIGIGGLLGSIIIYSIAYYANIIGVIIIISIIAGIVGYSRLYLQSHKPSQIYLGFILGFIGMSTIIYISFVV